MHVVGGGWVRKGGQYLTIQAKNNENENKEGKNNEKSKIKKPSIKHTRKKRREKNHDWSIKTL